jgi:hypothetical protein
MGSSTPVLQEAGRQPFPRRLAIWRNFDESTTCAEEARRAMPAFRHGSRLSGASKVAAVSAGR